MTNEINKPEAGNQNKAPAPTSEEEKLAALEDPPAEFEVKPAQDAGFEAPRVVSRPQGESKSHAGGEKGTVQITAVAFHSAGKIYDFESGNLALQTGETVILETDDGLAFAAVVIAPRSEPTAEYSHPLKKIIRKTTYDDMRQHEKNKEREQRAFQICTEKIRQYHLAMKLIHVEYLHSGSKAIFYFSSESRVDFRKLVRELAQEFHTRIEMRQIGPRDETKFMGGIGVCGRELCCTTWLRDFDPISIKMAKEQELSLNPSKLAGQCGRLKCCLAYEYETYVHIKKGLPKIGKKVCWKDGSPCGRISGHNIFQGTLRVALEDGTEQVIKADDVQLATAPESA